MCPRERMHGVERQGTTRSAAFTKQKSSETTCTTPTHSPQIAPLGLVHNPPLAIRSSSTVQTRKELTGSCTQRLSGWEQRSPTTSRSTKTETDKKSRVHSIQAYNEQRETESHARQRARYARTRSIMTQGGSRVRRKRSKSISKKINHIPYAPRARDIDI